MAAYLRGIDYPVPDSRLIPVQPWIAAGLGRLSTAPEKRPLPRPA